MKILSFSDILWSQYQQLVNIVTAVNPDLVILAGDIAGNGFSLFSRAPNRLKWFLNFLEQRRTETFTVKGNWDRDAYDRLFRRPHYKFVIDISGKYVRYKGLTFLGIPYSFFESLKSVKRIRQEFQQPADVIIAHPPTKRRIWIFDLRPKLVFLGHDDLRLCKVLNSLLISTNSSPANFAILTFTKNHIDASYRQYRPANSIGGYSPWSHEEAMKRLRSGELREGYLTFNATWQPDSKTLAWKTEEHFCYQPPYAYPARDTEYGEILERLVMTKNTVGKGELPAELAKSPVSKVPKVLITEYLGI